MNVNDNTPISKEEDMIKSLKEKPRFYSKEECLVIFQSLNLYSTDLLQKFMDGVLSQDSFYEKYHKSLKRWIVTYDYKFFGPFSSELEAKTYGNGIISCQFCEGSYEVSELIDPEDV